MNSAASIVLPQPGPPITSDGRPRGRPPAVTSSRPSIPLGAFGTGAPSNASAPGFVGLARALAPFFLLCVMVAAVVAAPPLVEAGEMPGRLCRPAPVRELFDPGGLRGASTEHAPCLPPNEA